jgi:hypothetical protein
MEFSELSIDKTRNEELWFKAEMTHRQFASLAQKLNDCDIENEIINLSFFKNKIVKSKKLNLEEVEKWLKNSWNTENVLNQNKSIIDNTGQSFAMQWAFPQAYYSIFGSLLAHFKALGYPQESHSSVIKNFAHLIEENKFPKSISFYCTGPKNKYVFGNINKPYDLTPIEFDSNNIDTIDNHICQFLKATREIKLIEKAPDLKFKNKKGQKRKKLSPLMWKQVSDSLGHTTIMDLLYRKRIKANYQDIDTFSSIHFKGIEVLSNLGIIVNRLNLINEVYISKAIGIVKYQEMLDRHLIRVTDDPVKMRFETIKNILNI